MEEKNEVSMEIEEDGKMNKTNKNGVEIVHQIIKEKNEPIEKNQKKNKNLNNKKVELNTKTSSEQNTSCSTNFSTNSSINSINSESKDCAIFIEPISQDLKEKVKFCLEYKDEIYANLIDEEKNAKNIADPNYFTHQNDINYQMRMILVDWLIEINDKFQCKENTLYQTINLIDLYLSKKKISRTNFQLLGVACQLISCKENEIYFPNLQEFVKIADDSFTLDELKEMEKKIMKVLNFDILYPTSLEFYNILSKEFNLNTEQHYLGEYFLCNSLVNYSMLKYKNSTIAKACIYIAMKKFNLPEYKQLFNSKLNNGETSKIDIKPCARDLCFFVEALSKSSLRATHDKYSSEKFLNVASLCD